MPEGLPGHAGVDHRQRSRRVFEGPGPGQAILGRHPDALQLYVGLHPRALGRLAGYRARPEAESALLDEEAPEVPLLVARPDDCDVGEGAVPDPALLPVQHVLAADPTGAGLQHRDVGAVLRLGQCERPKLFHPCHRGEPPLLLLLTAEYGDGVHGEARVRPEEGIDGARRRAASGSHLYDPWNGRLPL